MRLAVTTALDPDAAEREAAARVAAEFGWKVAPRGRRGLARVAVDCQADALLVLSARRAALWIDGTERAWTAGMGELRLQRLLRGEHATLDGLLAAAALQPGDAVLDATLGLGMDALVMAAAVGPGGSVVGLEASPVLAALTAEGLRRHPAEAARRITVRASDADAFLAQLPARSFDV
ncbi:MAG TPA: class I SAM-dependent methyltransferase, partial [Polyangia bacterium]|nr:class I SAM-dependent methyltransferase [Polyangia bacterium]